MTAGNSQTPPAPARSMPAELETPAQAVADLYAWIGAHWLSVTIALGVGIALYLLLTVLRRAGRRLCARDTNPRGLGALLGRALARTWHVFMMLVAARLVIGYANPPGWLLETTRFLFTIVSVFQVTIWLREMVLGFLERQTDPETGHETLSNAFGIIRLLVTVAMFVIAIVVVLDNIGVNVTGLVAGLGIGGIAIGLAAQGIFSDLFAALSIIFDRPFKVGDTITYDGTTGTVERIGLKSTRLLAVTGERKIISNTQLLGKEITNLAGLDYRRRQLTIGIIYQTPPDVAAGIPALLKEIVEGEGAQFVRCGFTGFGASSLDFDIWFHVTPADWEHVYQVRHRIVLAIVDRFNAAGIEFAYPTQTSFTAAPDGKLVLPYPTDGFTLKSE